MNDPAYVVTNRFTLEIIMPAVAYSSLTRDQAADQSFEEMVDAIAAFIEERNGVVSDYNLIHQTVEEINVE